MRSSHMRKKTKPIELQTQNRKHFKPVLLPALKCFCFYFFLYFMILSASHACCDAASFPLLPPTALSTHEDTCEIHWQHVFSFSFVILISIRFRFRFCFRFGVFLFRLLSFVIWFICQKLPIYQTISSCIYIYM